MKRSPLSDVHGVTDVHLGGADDVTVSGAHDDGHVIGGRGVVRGRGGEALVTPGHPGEATHGGWRPVSLVCLVREGHAVREEHQLVSPW